MLEQITHQEYHARTENGSGAMKAAFRSKRHLETYLSEAHEFDETRRHGLSLHAHLLEHDMSRIRLLATEGKRTPDDMAFERLEDGVTLKPHQWEAVQAAAAECRAHPWVAKLLAAPDLEVEASGFWKSGGVPGRLRLDAFSLSLGIAADLKSCGDARRDGFAIEARKNLYDLQFSWYRDGMRHLGYPELRWFWIASEIKRPHLCMVHECSAEVLKIADEMCQKACNNITDGRSGYPTTVSPLPLNRWVREEEDVSEGE